MIVEKNLILGIDIGSRSMAGVYLNEDGNIVSSFIITSEIPNKDRRMFYVCEKLRIYLDLLRPKVVVFEIPPFVNNMEVFRILSGIFAIGRFICLEKNLSYQSVANMTWKKTIIGAGNSSKEDIKNYFLRRWPLFCFEYPQDFYDAACIAEYQRLNPNKLLNYDSNQDID